jgi:hypothetical protein
LPETWFTVKTKLEGLGKQSNFITRFIVRMNQKIDDGFVWCMGVVLKIGENKALVKADIEDRKITIAVDGIEHTRRDALSEYGFSWMRYMAR